MLSIGLMSGTSMDGIDAALLATDGTPQSIHPIAHYHLNYAPQFTALLKIAEFAVKKFNGNMEKAHAHFILAMQEYLQQEFYLSMEGMELKLAEFKAYLYHNSPPQQRITLTEVIQHSTALHATAVKELLRQTDVTLEDIDVIGYHGQTLFHQPGQGISVVVGNGPQLADATGITVVNDFRRRDIAEGGQGAPFAPLYHQALAVRDNKMPLVVVNCGGISNISAIYGPEYEDVFGFDTGPGNALLDSLVRQRTQGKENMDKDGVYGLKGKVDDTLLALLQQKAVLKDGKDYLTLPAPKSLDYNDMVLIDELEKFYLEDACATLAAFTAQTLVQSIQLLPKQAPAHWVLAGGGWKNPVIHREFVQRLQAALSADVSIEMADDAGWNSQFMEAEIFAYLAVRSLHNEPISFPSTTCVPKPLCGGHAFVPCHGTTAVVRKLLAANPDVLMGYSGNTR